MHQLSLRQVAFQEEENGVLLLLGFFACTRVSCKIVGRSQKGESPKASSQLQEVAR